MTTLQPAKLQNLIFRNTCIWYSDFFRIFPNNSDFIFSRGERRVFESHNYSKLADYTRAELVKFYLRSLQLIHNRASAYTPWYSQNVPIDEPQLQSQFDKCISQNKSWFFTEFEPLRHIPLFSFFSVCVGHSDEKLGIAFIIFFSFCITRLTT